MNYQEAMKYMEKVGTYGIVPGLDSIRELCRRLGDPQNDLKRFHTCLYFQYLTGCRIPCGKIYITCYY